MIQESKIEPTYKIFDYVREGIGHFDPLAIDDKKDVLIRFSEKVTIDERGFKTKIEQYESDLVTIDPVTLVRTITYSDLVKCTDVSYVIGSDDALLSRTETYSFVKEVDNVDTLLPVGIPKVKGYTGVESLSEGVKRRENVINMLKQRTAYYILLTEASVNNVPEAEVASKSIGEAVAVETGNFISINTANHLIAAIAGIVDTRLDNVVDGNGSTIRDVMMFTIQNSNL